MQFHEILKGNVAKLNFVNGRAVASVGAPVKNINPATGAGLIQLRQNHVSPSSSINDSA